MVLNKNIQERSNKNKKATPQLPNRRVEKTEIEKWIDLIKHYLCLSSRFNALINVLEFNSSYSTISFENFKNKLCSWFSLLKCNNYKAMT